MDKLWMLDEFARTRKKLQRYEQVHLLWVDKR